MRIVLICCCVFIVSSTAFAQPEEYAGAIAQEDWTVLHLRKRPNPKPHSFTKATKLISLSEFQITGPMPGHPFVLGNYAADGEWGLIDGYVQKLSGNNPAMELGWADQFELEGVAEHAGHGGWFLLLGWDEGHGHGVTNCNLINSGSPWFVSRFRSNKAIPEGTQELPSFDWNKEQPFKVVVKESALSFTIGKFKVLEDHPLDGYTPGRIIFGVYENKYGVKPIRFKSLRLKSLPPEVKMDQPEANQ